MGVQVTASPSVLPGGTTVAGNLTVTGAMGVGTAPLGGVLLSVLNTQNGAVPILIRAAGAQAADILTVQTAGQNPLGGIDNGGAVREGNALALGATRFSGTGAPAGGLGSNGDFYDRVDGAALTTIYQKRAGVWTGIV